MQDTRIHWLRFVLLGASVTPLLYGLCAAVSPSALAKLTYFLSRGEYQRTPALDFIGKPMGAYLFFLGLVLLVIATDPLRYRPLVVWASAFFLFRGCQRLYFTSEINAAFGIAPVVNITHAGALLLLGCLVFWLRPRVVQDSSA